MLAQAHQARFVRVPKVSTLFLPIAGYHFNRDVGANVGSSTHPLPGFRVKVLWSMNRYLRAFQPSYGFARSGGLAYFFTMGTKKPTNKRGSSGIRKCCNPCGLLALKHFLPKRATFIRIIGCHHDRPKADRKETPTCSQDTHTPTIDRLAVSCYDVDMRLKHSLNRQRGDGLAYPGPFPSEPNI